ncbi:hypothetical protein [Niveispirillum sp. KHB5.9]|uniref:hypothetical protein n=1 Tax=Niveispirillum sp. KHB5.9 TaxID=3400269 RepID=UPI003A89FA11
MARLDMAESLAAGGEAVMLAWGGMAPPEGAVPTGVTLWPLPPAREDEGMPGLILDADGQVADHAWKKRRAAALLALFAGMRPRLIVLDAAGPGFRFELEPLTGMARRRVPMPEIRVWS